MSILKKEIIVCPSCKGNGEMIVHHYRNPEDIVPDKNNPVEVAVNLCDKVANIITVEHVKNSCPTCGGTGRVKQYSIAVGFYLTAKEFFMIDKNGIKHTIGKAE